MSGAQTNGYICRLTAYTLDNRKVISMKVYA